MHGMEKAPNDTQLEISFRQNYTEAESDYKNYEILIEIWGFANRY
jgi:hypothetical protein